MRIGMMADIYKPHVSGVTNYIALNKSFLEEMGHEVFIFTFGDDEYKDDESNVIRSPGLPLLDTGFYLNLRYSKIARQLLHSMDIVHVHHPFLSGSLALRYCAPRGIPIVYTNHTRYDLYTRAYIPALPDVIGLTALEAYMPAFCRACNLVIAPSAGMKHVLERFGVDSPIEVVPNGVNLEPFQKTINAHERSEFGIKPDNVILAYVGRLGPEKNLPFLLRSFAGAANAYENIYLLIVGDGPEKDNLQDRVKHMKLNDRVKFTGLIPYLNLPAYLAMSDAFVTASVTEVHPLSVIEAMASGLPILGIESPGVGDTVEDGVTGLLAPEEDIASFTAKMVLMISDHDHRKKMGESAKIAAEKYNIESTTQMMLNLYTSVITSAKEQNRGLRARILRLIHNMRN